MLQTLVPPSFPAVQRHPLKIVALGDSLIYGFGDPLGGGWVERLRRQWMMESETTGHVLYNLGIRGNRVAQVSDRLENEFRQRGELRHNNPDAILLSVGVNDSARLGRPHGRLFTDKDVFAHQIEELLDKANQLCSVFFIGMVPVDETKMPFMDCFYYNHQDQYLYKEITRLACEARNIPYLDIFDLWTRRGDLWFRSRLCADGLHPNVSGYESLFKDVISWIAVDS